MATSTTGTGNKPNVGLPIIIIAIVVLIGLMAMMYHHAFAPPPPPAESAAYKQKEDGWRQLAIKSHGDISQLSQQEQATLMQQTGGHGAMILKGLYQTSQH